MVATKKFIEMQSPGSETAMVGNAVTAGYAASAVEVVDVTPADWDVIQTLRGADSEDADGFREELATIFAGTADQQCARMLDVVEKYAPWGDALGMLRGGLTPGAKGFVLETARRVKAKIGTANEILTATEYQALKALADAKRLGMLVPTVS